MLKARIAAARTAHARATVDNKPEDRPEDTDDEESSSRKKRRVDDCRDVSDDDESSPQASQSDIRSFMLQRMVSDPKDPRSASTTSSSSWASRMHSAAWWARSMHNSVADTWDLRHRYGGLLRPPLLHEACAGVGAGFMACQCLGIPLDGHGCCASECKPYAREFLLKHNPSVAHVFSTMAEHVNLDGYDFKNARHVTLEKTSLRPDVMVLGPPCQPFSQLRSDRYRTNCEDHRLFGATFGGPACSQGSVLEVLQGLMPRVAIVEQVVGFTRSDPISGVSPLSQFLQKVRDMKTGDDKPLYPACHVFDMDPKAWLKISRPRTVRALRLCWCGIGHTTLVPLVLSQRFELAAVPQSRCVVGPTR
jgi:hypothetical protein